MTIRIFKNCGESTQAINHVTNVVTHSVAIGMHGIDIDIQRIETGEIINERIHLDEWDFYSIGI